MKLLNSTICLHTKLSESNERNPRDNVHQPIRLSGVDT